MQYINPFELLDLTTDNLSAVDGNAVNKAKRKLFAEIKLSDNNAIKHNGSELTKSDCIRAIDDLDNKDKREFHFFISQNKNLNKFLSSGHLHFFDNFQVESIYKLPDFLDFVSPFFCEQYDKLLSENYKKGNLENVAKILSVKPITNETYSEKCYKSTYSLLRTANSNIKKIKKDIDNENSLFINQAFKGLAQAISREVNIPLLNILPSYFQSIRNQLAQTINELSTTVNNKPYNSYEAAFKIIELAKNISTDGLAAQKITKNYYIIKKNFDTIRPKPTVTTNKPTTIKDEEEDEEEQEQIQEEIKKENKSEKKNYSYWIFLCVLFIVGFFYSPVQKIILGLSILILLFSLLLIYKEKDFLFTNLLKKNFIFIAAASLGFWYPLIAQLYISYHFLVYLHTLYDKVTI